ncbi:hypothetical protein EF918_32290 [Streptomyces sp. WAC06614]|nr:hypothetical protein EF918_32290 [Streptomyces sp. WAC06614]
MAINPPDGIADFLGFVSGMPWPEADEDLMRRVSEHYASIAQDLGSLSGYVLELIPIVKSDFDGEAADAFLVAMRDLTGQTAGGNQLEETATLARQLSEVALKVANQVEYTKIMAILQLVELLSQILFATIFSPFTFGAVWGPVSVAFLATREGLKNLFLWLLNTILTQTFIGLTGGIFRDMVVQLYQLGSGHSKQWNTPKYLLSSGFSAYWWLRTQFWYLTMTGSNIRCRPLESRLMATPEANGPALIEKPSPKTRL